MRTLLSVTVHIIYLSDIGILAQSEPPVDKEGEQTTVTFENENNCPVVIDPFSVYDGLCCNLNVDCQSICCLEGVCAAKEPCPRYDGSIDEYERKFFDAIVDQEAVEQKNDNLDNEKLSQEDK